jgi:UDP-N-acetylmuramoyl-tripeptide--D-alanyl-D-alanine ligase
MKVAIENFANIHADKKILLLGGMMELGEASINEHKKLLMLIQQYDFPEVILVGGNFEQDHATYKYFKTSEAAAEYMQKQNFQHSYFLIKGSRSMQMEKVLTAFAQ